VKASGSAVGKLRAQFEAVGALSRERVTTYCEGSIAASSDAFVLMLLGMPNVAVYGGSLLESGDSLRGWGLGLNIPVVLMVGYRGWTRHGVTQDTAATYTERFLHAFGINYYLVENNTDAPRISMAFQEARKTKRPVAVLVGDEYHGFNR
jgi:sulfopyruvate decarboxylase TPP-binding subunit